MNLKPWHFYIWIASIIVFILFIAGFAKEEMPPASRTFAVFYKQKPHSSKLFEPFVCKGKTVFACTVKYLYYLRYLPIRRIGQYQYKFSFPVPAVLRGIADSYEWNSQNPIILGAISQYLEVSGRLSDGEYAKPQINGTLLSELEKSAVNREFNPHKWKWVLIKQSAKGEKTELYENGRKFFSSPVNTGEFATTPDGTWYVYLRFHSTAMSGLSPTRVSRKVYESLKLKHPNMVGCLDGHTVKWIKYDDSDIKYVDFFNGGIALHYIYRLRYGFPQSAGCVELSRRNAKFLYENIGYGTIVTVAGIIKPRPLKKHRSKSTADGTCVQPRRLSKPGRSGASIKAKRVPMATMVNAKAKQDKK